MENTYAIVLYQLPEGSSRGIYDPCSYRGGHYRITETYHTNLIDGYLQVTDEEATGMTRRLAKEEGIFAGFSSGANVAAAIQLLNTICKGKIIVVLLSDSGLKYLSTDLWL